MSDSWRKPISGFAAIGTNAETDHAPSRVGAISRRLIVFGSILATGALGISLPRWGGSLTLWILPSGIAVAAVIRWGREQWLPIFASEMALELLNGASPLAALLVGTGLPAGALLTAWILDRYGFNAQFTRRRDVLLFIAAGLVGMIPPAAIGTLAKYLLYVVIPATGSPWLWIDAIGWWLNDFAGLLLLGALLVALRTTSFDRPIAQPLASAICLGLLLALLAAVATLSPEHVNSGIAQLLVLVASMTLAVVLCLLFGLVPAAFAACLLSVTEALCYSFNLGLFQELDYISGHVVLWSHGGAMIGVTLMLTALLAERDMADARQLRAELRYALAVAGANDAIWDIDLRAGQSYFSPRFGNLLSLAPDDPMPARLQDLRGRVHPEDLPLTESSLHRQLQQHEPLQVEFRLRTGSGDYRWFRARAQAVWNEAGEMMRIAGSVSDINEQKQAQESLLATQMRELQAQKQFTHDLLTAQDAERLRLANELHDGLGQNLSLIANRAQMALADPSEPASLLRHLEAIGQITADAIAEVRALAGNLRPFRVGQLGITDSIDSLIQQLADSSTLRIERHLEPVDDVIGRDESAHLYRITQEALTNVLKHAEAQHVVVHLERDVHCIRLIVRDDGRGFDPQAPYLRRGSVGIHSLRERAQILGGSVVFNARAGHGTEVRVEIPLRTEDGAAAEA